MAEYDPNILREFANRLYAHANMVVVAYTLVEWLAYVVST